MSLKSTIIYFILLTGFVFSQEHRSIHYYDKLSHKIDIGEIKNQSVYDEIHSMDIMPLNKNAIKDLSAKVFGYFPDWEYLGGSHNYFRYDLLTHIACFDFPVSSTGNISNPAQWPWTDVINTAHSKGVKIIMVVTNFDKDDIRKIITDETTKQKFITNALIKYQAYSFDGINVDFESLYSADEGSRINNFMAELSDSVHAHFPEAEVSFAAPAVNWGSDWDFNGLANACDYLFIMGYDFFGSWSTYSGPTAPLTGGSYNITNTIVSQYSSVVASLPEKLILGVPYFGSYYITEGSAAGSKVIDYVKSPRFRDAQAQANVYGRLWDSRYQVPWYRWYESEWNQVWYDDYVSLGLKYDLAQQKNLAGIGMWALGYDGERQELWNLIDYKFGSGQLPPPATPESFRILADADTTLRIQFDVALTSTSNLLMLSTDGKNFNDTVEVFSNDIIVEGLQPNTPYYFKIAAKNQSGLSNASEVLCGVPADSAVTDILVVNGFDRVTNTNNTFDYIRNYAKPILDNGYSFVSSSNEAIFKGRLSLSKFKTVIWMLGDESTADETFNKFEQDSIKAFLNNGGNLFVSGSEIGWDLGRSSYSSNDDIYFYNNYLKARYISDAPENSKATYYKVEPVSGGLFDGIGQVSFDNGTHGTIDVDWPDAIGAVNGATDVLKFVGVSTAKGVSGVAYHGRFPSGIRNGSLVHLSVPFETFYPESKRTEIMSKVLNYFETMVDVNEFAGLNPDKFILYPNYPNPFNPGTNIKYYLPNNADVELRIVNSLGQIIYNKSFGGTSKGYHEFYWNGTNRNGLTVATGMYIYQIIVNYESGERKIFSNKMMLLK